MENNIHFHMLVEINQILKKKGIAYSVHSVGGCATCALQLRQDGDDYSIDKIIDIINDYLKDKWLKVILNPYDPLSLIVQSTFPQ